jgi:hypothetical protein
MTTAIPLNASSERPTIDQVGSKALSLIDMTREGMPVPPGFVLTVQFFEPWIRALEVAQEWEAIQNAAADDLGQATQALQAVCRDLLSRRIKRKNWRGPWMLFERPMALPSLQSGPRHRKRTLTALLLRAATRQPSV